MKIVELRNTLKAKKPTFVRHDAHKKKRVTQSWRRPKGRQNKMRLNIRGYKSGRTSGYGSPNAARGLSHEGLVQVVAHSVADIKGANPKTDGIIIARTVGARKKLELIKAAQAASLKILNVDVAAFEKKVADSLQSKKEKKKAFEKKQQEKEKAAKTESKEKTDDKKAEDKEVSAEDKKMQEKKEHDKVLTQKGDQA